MKGRKIVKVNRMVMIGSDCMVLMKKLVVWVMIGIFEWCISVSMMDSGMFISMVLIKIIKVRLSLFY